MWQELVSRAKEERFHSSVAWEGIVLASQEAKNTPTAEGRQHVAVQL